MNRSASESSGKAMIDGCGLNLQRSKYASCISSDFPVCAPVHSVTCWMAGSTKSLMIWYAHG